MDGFQAPFMYNSFPSSCTDGKEVDVGSSYFTNTELNLCSRYIAVPNNFNLGASRRNGSSGSGFSLALELGSLGSPVEIQENFVGTDLTCERNFEKRAPSGMYLDLDLNIQGKRERKEARNPGLSISARVEESPKIDLDLSLSTGFVESDVTSVTLSSSPVQKGIEAQALSDIVQLVDEGSTSSKWKRGSFLPPLDNNNHSNNMNPASATSCLPSILIQPPKSLDGTNASKPPRKSVVKTCQFSGCEKGARGASGHCISHGGGHRCQRLGCQKGAEGKTAFCKAHGGGQRCEHLGCTKSAEGRTNLCIAHGGGRRCSFPEGCNRAARGKSGLCIRHGGGKRCKVEDCTRSAEGLSALCIAHGGGRRCHFPECTKGSQGGTKFCKAHGGGKRCTFIGCTKGAEGSTLFCKGHGGGKRCTFQGGGVCTKSVHGGTLFCVSHGGGKRCATSGCTKSARGRTNFCVRHGGGRRCKYEGCPKSAQGRTDFCKAHGGGKPCLWGQPGSGFGGDDTDAPCDKFARGNVGLCSAHAALIDDKRVHGNGTVALKMQETITTEVGPLKFSSNNVCEQHPTIWGGFELRGHEPCLSPMKGIGQCGGSLTSASASLPEGRVHGGSLMAFYISGASEPLGADDRMAGSLL